MGRGVRRPTEVRERDAAAWVDARRAGVSVAEIAREAGVGGATVSRATSARGPFPARGRRSHPAAEWARLRRDGQTVRRIANEAGVSESTVSAATAPYGPFPLRTGDTESALGWVRLRHAGVSMAAIARREGVSAARVSSATRRLGRFPRPTPGDPGTVGLRGISRMSGVSLPALRRRIDQGELPAPAGHRDGGWPYWRIDDIARYLEQSDLEACPQCGARLKRLDWHLLSRHGPPVRHERNPRHGHAQGG